MSVIDSARFMAVITAAEADAMIAVMDAKYKYAFWRTITAIRNGDIDGNAATRTRDHWQPIDNTRDRAQKTRCCSFRRRSTLGEAQSKPCSAPPIFPR